MTAASRLALSQRSKMGRRERSKEPSNATVSHGKMEQSSKITPFLSSTSRC